MTAPAGAGGIRLCLSTAVVSAVALVLTLVVISLSVGSSLPAASLRVYLTAGAYDGSKNGTAADLLLSEGDQEPSPEQRSPSGTTNSSEASFDTREFNRKMPEPVATGDTDTTE